MLYQYSYNDGCFYLGSRYLETDGRTHSVQANVFKGDALPPGQIKSQCQQTIDGGGNIEGKEAAG